MGRPWHLSANAALGNPARFAAAVVATALWAIYAWGKENVNRSVAPSLSNVW